MPIYILNNAYKKRNKKRTYVYDLGRGDTGAKSQPCYLVDPPQEFDEEGKELGPDAQVWKTYVKEADRVDEELVDGWNKSMDVNLIFAALFSAISTAFVIESYKNLKPDPADISAQTLTVISQTLSLLANASQPATATPGSDDEPATFKPSPSAICVNVLWFLSLSLSVAVSLVSMLAKEWCLEFMSGRTGPPGAQARRRQRRWDGLESWRMKGVLTVLPSLIHLSLLLFAIGLCVFLWDVHYGVAIPVVLVTTIAAGVYFACTILPLIDHYCPYGTVLSRLYKQFSSEYSQSVRDGGKQDETTSRALHWMIVNCETPRSVDVALQSLAGAERGLQHEMLERCDAWSMIRHRMDLINPIGEKADPASVLYKRALACHVRTRTQWIFEQGSTEQLVALVLGVQACINSVIYKLLEQPRWSSSRSILEQCRLIGPQLLHFEYRISMTDSALPSLFSDAYSSAIDMHPQRSEALAESLTQLLEQHINGFIEMEPAQHGALCTSLVLLLSYKIAGDPSLIVPYILRLIRAYCQNDELEHTHSRIQAHRVGNDLSLTTLAFLLGTVAVLNTGCFVKEPPWFSNTLLSDCTSVTRSNALRNRVVELGWQYLLSIVYPGISWFEWNYYLIHGGFHLLAGAREYNINSEDCIMITKIVPEGYPLSMSSVGEKETRCFAHHLQELTNALTDHPDLDALPSPLLTCLRVLLAMARGLTYLQPSPDSYVLTLEILSWDNKKGEVGEFCRLMRYFPFPKASPRLIDLLSTSGVFTRLINWLESEDFGRQTFAIGQTWLLLNMSIQAPDRKSDAMNKLETMLLEYPGLNNELGEQEAVAEDLECRFLTLLNGDDVYRVVELDHDAGIYLYRILELMLQQRCTPLPQIVNFKLQEVHKTLRGIHSFVDLEVEAADRFRSDNVAHDDQESMNDDPSTTSPDA